MKLLHNVIRNWKIVLPGVASTVVLLALFILIMDKIVMPLYIHLGKDVELPDIEYIAFEEAKETLEENGFKIVIEGEKYDATFPESTVVFQNPRPFSHVKKGRRIYLTLSAGERMVPVPRVIGMSEKDAIFKLEEAGLQLGEVFYEYNYKLNGVVCNQAYPEGTEIVAKDPVDITVSLGPLPAHFIVPDLVGKDVEIAKKMVLRAGLRVGIIRYEMRDDFVPDTVIRQSIQAGEEVRQNQPVNLVVSQLAELF